ncbi:Superfamily I DNA and RNA helicase [Bacteroidales bacterium Barb6]|nr:Superfamily I DNA and RNA helicase [Bacteroidales bacterium Barb6]
MATLIPTIDKILRFKVKPEEGELALLRFLEKTLDNSFEIYFNPYMNGDRPDIVIMRKGYGVLIIEVKDWDINLYELDEKKHWKLKTESAILKSPIQQVFKYKNNLFELHIDTLLEKKIKDIRKFNIVTCAVYFHNANESQIKNLLVDPYKDNQQYQDFLKYNIDLIGRDNLNELDLNKILKRRYLKADKESFLFTTDLYDSIRRFLNPPIHMKEEGVDFHYSKKQTEIIYERDKKQQRIKGVVGSGKTTVLAARAIQAYKRISINSPESQVLILTFNITLKNFIHDKISKAREEFPWNAFVISNYHLFINSQLNNLGIPFEKEKLGDLEGNYYSNKKLFSNNKHKIKKFDAIFIDEIQDYKRAWMEIIKDCFLSDEGEYVLFGDVKQNIYNNLTEHKDISTNVRGVPIKLERCFRSDFKIKDLAIEYQKRIFQEKYEIDTFNDNSLQPELPLERNQQGYINYMYLSNTNIVSTLYTIIHENIINKNSSISPNDITILGYTVNQLKKFEAYYRYMSGEKTKTMFETWEIYTYPD